MKTNREVSNKLKYRFKGPKRWSIQRCLFVLGAKPSEAYYYHKEYGVNYQNKLAREKQHRSIYRRYTPDELRMWGDGLYRQAIRKYHPDGHSRRLRNYFGKKTTEINIAYDNLKRILGYHGVRG